MASAMASITIALSIDFSRATASAIWTSSSLLALTAMVFSSGYGARRGGPALSLNISLSVRRLLAATFLLAFPAGAPILAQRLADQFVGQHQPRRGKGAERQFDG